MISDLAQKYPGAAGEIAVSGLADTVVQVGHLVSLDDLRVIQEHGRCGVVAGEPDAGAEDDGTKLTDSSSTSPAARAHPVRLPAVRDTSRS